MYVCARTHTPFKFCDNVEVASSSRFQNRTQQATTQDKETKKNEGKEKKKRTTTKGTEDAREGRGGELNINAKQILWAFALHASTAVAVALCFECALSFCPSCVCVCPCVIVWMMTEASCCFRVSRVSLWSLFRVFCRLLVVWLSSCCPVCCCCVASIESVFLLGSLVTFL